MSHEPQLGIDFFDPEDDEGDLQAHESCGRWTNGRLGRSCSQAGTEFCDFECPYRDAWREAA